MLENTINDLRGLSVRSVEREGDRAGELDSQRKLAEQGEYNRAVERAEAARDAELGRKRRFSDTAVGKLYNDMGGASAVLAAAAAGGAHNWATGGKTDFANKILWPALEGTGASFAAMNLPLVYDAFATDTDNPEKAAYAAYARELPPTTGNGDFSVSGSPPTGFRTLSQVLTNGDTFYYVIAHQSANEWETGLGTFGGSNTFVRTQVYSSTNSNNAVSFSSGAKEVFLGHLASKTPYFNAAGNLVGFGGDKSILDDSGNELLRFQKTASAVNEVAVTNAATGNAPQIAPSGGDTNIDLKLVGKGTGVPKVGTDTIIHAGNLPAHSGIGVLPGRLSLASGSAITTSDITAATSIYYTPVIGQHAPIYDGTKINRVDLGGELTLALDSDSGHTGYHQADRNFDLFLIDDSSTPRLGSSPDWTAGSGSATARGTGAGSTELELFNGLLVNKNTMTIRFGSSSGNTVSVPARQATFVGSFRATANGQTEDSEVKRLVSNAYNQAPRRLRRADVSASVGQTTSTLRQANNNADNKVAVLNCLEGVFTEAEIASSAANSTSTMRTCFLSLGLDSTTVGIFDLLRNIAYVTDTLQNVAFCRWRGSVGLGFHELVWLEGGAGTDTQTWSRFAVYGIQGEHRA